MESKKLISELSSYMAGKGLKNKQVETDLGLPKNSLSNFLSLKKVLPQKWNEPILKYISQSNVVINTLGDLKDKVTTADKVPIPETKLDLKEVDEDIDLADRLKSFCKQYKTNPDDLFAWLMENYGKKPSVAKSPKNDQKEPLEKKPSKFTSDWRKQLVKAKTGYSPK